MFNLLSRLDPAEWQEGGQEPRAYNVFVSLTAVQVQARLSPDERQRLVRRAKLLAWGGVVWHFAEFAIAIGAGIAASSVALIGFGADSFIESAAGFVIIWRFAESRAHSQAAERRAQQLIAASFILLAGYIGVEAMRSV